MLTPENFGGNPYMEVSGIEFIPRKTQYDKAQWQPHCHPFHDSFNCLEYDVIKEMCPHLFGSNAGTTSTGYSPNVAATANSTRPDGIYPPRPQVPVQGPSGQFTSPQQNGFYPPAGQQTQTFTQPQPAHAASAISASMPTLPEAYTAPVTGSPGIF